MSQDLIWQVQKAKARLCALIRVAERWPQTITLRGKPVVMVVPHRMFQDMIKEIRTLREARKAGPPSD